jgi:hypothetical protein
LRPFQQLRQLGDVGDDAPESLEANDSGVCRFGGGMEIVHAAKLDPMIE